MPSSGQIDEVPERILGQYPWLGKKVCQKWQNNCQKVFLCQSFCLYLYCMIKRPNPDQLMKWALKRLGPSKCKYIQIVNQPRWTFYGDWNWDGRIRINIAHISYQRKLYAVLAHEWTHAQQYWKDYKKYFWDYEYWHHPLEVEARAREKSMDYRIPAWCKKVA